MAYKPFKRLMAYKPFKHRLAGETVVLPDQTPDGWTPFGELLLGSPSNASNDRLGMPTRSTVTAPGLFSQEIKRLTNSCSPLEHCEPVQP
jgi:hypothetical protein